MREYRRLRLALDIGIVLLAIVCATLWIRYFVGRAPAFDRTAGYVQGDELPPLTGVALESSPRSILLLLNSKCSFCDKSMPFFQKLVEVRDRLKSPVQIAAVSFETRDTLTQYLVKRGFKPDVAVSIDPRSGFHHYKTPTVMLVRPDRTIERMWVGLLPLSDQDAVFGSLHVGATAGS